MASSKTGQYMLVCAYAKSTLGRAGSTVLRRVAQRVVHRQVIHSRTERAVADAVLDGAQRHEGGPARGAAVLDYLERLLRGQTRVNPRSLAAQEGGEHRSA